ncbi:hypothetical protein NP233_g423 [Leucocoprinus birnbaumii]|uniref:DUF6534 domain-containing protein n=1 Tax=Leucocoprinus birnbaumii TaxID=56174 RepID=A0AAD5Z099_9AGAR|nr:hypothetical protein NP233_g423 [Leucocoprinus birnbaumii]
MTVIGTATDFAIAGFLCYYVRKRSEEIRDMRITSVIVTQVIRYSVATTALTSLLIMMCLISYFVAPFTFVYLALNFSSGRTYANAVLVHLNARHKFRETLDSMEPSFAKSANLVGISSAIRRVPRTGDMNTREYPSRVPAVEAGNKLDSLVQVPLSTYAPRSRHSLP